MGINMPKRKRKEPRTRVSTPTTAETQDKKLQQPTHEQIARRAYELYLESGGASRHELEDWFQAEKELRNALESRTKSATNSLHGRSREGKFAW